MSASLRQFGWIVTRDVNRTVGGGMASMELLRRSFDARRWVDASTHALLVAVSRLTPGTNILAYCAAVGWRLHGWRGTFVALAAASIPGALIVFGLAVTLVRIDRYPVVRVVLSAGMLVAGALVLSSAWNLLKPYLRSDKWQRAIIIVSIAGALYLIGWTPVRVLLVSAIAGALLPVRDISASGRGSGPDDQSGREARPVDAIATSGAAPDGRDGPPVPPSEPA